MGVKKREGIVGMDKLLSRFNFIRFTESLWFVKELEPEGEPSRFFLDVLSRMALRVYYVLTTEDSLASYAPGPGVIFKSLSFFIITAPRLSVTFE